MSGRAFPYRLKAPVKCLELIDCVFGDQTEGRPGATLYLVGNPAPTTYLVKEEGDDVFVVRLGVMQGCSCGGGLATTDRTTGFPTTHAIAAPIALPEEAQEGEARELDAQGSIASGFGSRRDRSDHSPELCIHLMWVMLKALRAPPTHPSVWQLSLIDAELDTLLAFREERQREHAAKRHTSFLRRGAGRRGGAHGTAALGGGGADDGASSPLLGDGDGDGDGDETDLGVDADGWDGPTGATQKPICSDDQCPICLDDLMPPPSANQLVATQLPAVTYCRPSCGNNVHVKCFLEYVEHAAKSSHSPSGYQVTCLMCRQPWGDNALPWLRKHWAACQRRAQADGGAPAPLQGARGSEVHKGSRCGGCPATAALRMSTIKGARYCCVRCAAAHPPASWRAEASSVGSRFELCSECFGRGKHAQHAFVVKDLVGDPWRPAPRRVGGQQVWRPAAPLAAAGMSEAALVATLQARDNFGPNDYDLLLLLDEPRAQRQRQPQASVTIPDAQTDGSSTLGMFLALSLPVATVPADSTSCAHCGRLLSDPPPLHTLPTAASPSSASAAGAAEQPRRRPHPRKYPCSHTVHIECAAFAADDGGSVGGEGEAASHRSRSCSRFICPIPDCAQPTFPGIYRRPRSEAATTVEAAAEVLSAHAAPPAPSVTGQRSTGWRGAVAALEATGSAPLSGALTVTSVGGGGGGGGGGRVRVGLRRAQASQSSGANDERQTPGETPLPLSPTSGLAGTGIVCVGGRAVSPVTSSTNRRVSDTGGDEASSGGDTASRRGGGGRTRGGRLIRGATSSSSSVSQPSNERSVSAGGGDLALRVESSGVRSASPPSSSSLLVQGRLTTVSNSQSPNPPQRHRPVLVEQPLASRAAAAEPPSLHVPSENDMAALSVGCRQGPAATNSAHFTHPPTAAATTTGREKARSLACASRAAAVKATRAAMMAAEAARLEEELAVKLARGQTTIEASVKALKKRSGKRFATAQREVQALSVVIGQESFPPSTPPPPPPLLVLQEQQTKSGEDNDHSYALAPCDRDQRGSADGELSSSPLPGSPMPPPAAMHSHEGRATAIVSSSPGERRFSPDNGVDGGGGGGNSVGDQPDQGLPVESKQATRESRRSNALAALQERQANETRVAEQRRDDAGRRHTSGGLARAELARVGGEERAAVSSALLATESSAIAKAAAREEKVLAAAARRKDLADQESVRAWTEAKAQAEARRAAASSAGAAATVVHSFGGGRRVRRADGATGVEAAAQNGACRPGDGEVGERGEGGPVPQDSGGAESTTSSGPSVYASRAAAEHSAEVERRKAQRAVLTAQRAQQQQQQRRRQRELQSGDQISNDSSGLDLCVGNVAPPHSAPSNSITAVSGLRGGAMMRSQTAEVAERRRSHLNSSSVSVRQRQTFSTAPNRQEVAFNESSTGELAADENGLSMAIAGGQIRALRRHATDR